MLCCHKSNSSTNIIIIYFNYYKYTISLSAIIVVILCVSPM